MRGAALALVLAAIAAGVVLTAYDLAGARPTLVILGALGLLTVAATDALVRRRAKLGGLRRQAAWMGALVAGQLALGTALFVGLMLLNTHDAVLTGLMTAFASVLGLWAAQRLGQAALTDVTAIRATLAAVGTGRRDVTTGVRGGDEVARLAQEVDAMVGRLDRRNVRGARSSQAYRTTCAHRSQRCGCSPTRSTTTSQTRTRAEGTRREWGRTSGRSARSSTTSLSSRGCRAGSSN